MHKLTEHEIARNKIAEEYYDLACRIAHSISFRENVHSEELVGPATDGLMTAADAIAKNPSGVGDYKTYISAAVRNAINGALIKAQRQGFTGTSEIPVIVGIQDALSEDNALTVETTVASSENIEQDLIDRDEIQKKVSRLPSGYQEVMKLKAEDPFASNAEIARRLGKDEEAIKSIIRRARKYFDPFS